MFQVDARATADLEAERIETRALELRRLRQDQLERARLRHNAALEKELLKHVRVIPLIDIKITVSIISLTSKTLLPCPQTRESLSFNVCY